MRGECRKRGFLYIKLGGRVGIPDRLIVAPRVVAFAELKKSSGGVKGPLQDKWAEDLKALHHIHRFIYYRHQALELLEELANYGR